ncbi:LysR substrate-binding domain-containing protein [Cognatishimia sp. SS12]|uniref:LysR substrate-binding domain-containing protein n=1 Tax=Cognatishimia sp. SS12 TaxID=2979465 RepID=UPI00232F066B|nr:LysR substrate-binding domain-containing protein [Cognatishimia sp. SS12]MDC0737080.1 LysR substrate-binding domain-containing protein [Cognatishimia sp. SS12]
MDRNLPPLNAVKVFDAVVRKGSFSAAARALQISQSAVSKHIQNLEAFLGNTLLIRTRTGVSLTAEGAAFHQDTSSALGQIERATLASHATARGVHVLKISAPASLALRWLAPRLAEFHLKHGQLVLDLSVSDVCPDFATSGHDGAVVPGPISEAAQNWAHLFDEVVVPVCSPALIAAQPLSDPADLARLPLIHTTTRPELWTRWLSAHQSDQTGPRGDATGFGFQDFYLSIAAAISGLGVALVPTFLVREDLSEGRLVVPYEAPFKTDHAYWLATGSGKSRSTQIDVFGTWLVQELTHLS